MSAVAFLAGLGAGYISAKDKALEQERQAARDKRDQTTFDNQQADRATALADKQALRDAGAPVTAQETTQPFQSPADSTDMDMPVAAANTVPLAKTYNVGAKKFAGDGVAAQAEADKQSSPDGIRTRTMAALAEQGNVVGSDALKTSGLQAEASQMAINKGKREEANAVFDQGVVEALHTGGPEGLAKFLSDSHADGQKGEMKFAAIVNPNSKTWKIARVEKDGKLTPMSESFSSDENGYATAALMTSMAAKPEAKLAHMLAVKEAARKAEHDEGILAVAKKSAETQEQWRKDQAENMRQQRALQAKHDAAIAAGKSQPGQPLQLGLKDMRDFESDFNGYIKDQYPVKDGVDDKERASINAQATSAKALGSAIFQNNAQVGIPLTAGTVMQAMELGKDRTNVKIMDIGGVPHEAVIVNGQPVVISGALQKKAAPAPGTPAAVAAGGVQPAAQPAPAQATPAPALASQAPVRSIDGGKTWSLDVPDTIRDPSVPFYRQIPNPMAVALKGKTFASSQEAQAAFAQLNK